ncbi:type II secretion system protein [Campylobacter cuniculorum]|uniref:Type II secretion system protein n=2 Tax=Campylobacter cuniculorum TaxID=374106 RepID=A0A1W6BYU4_9BACT|nr:prepilin-type N-terminal cleavage/methylation domain-containing protein [Campylobacter cuniculorum]ARJ57254.1 hypothetical protein CCUN_1675 [Campylobacter cuniculorum DSM 23162 = LMG 24588]QOR04691.1 prepilin-type N-terminal cleavage/methylation domain-containing protein [Campylobacter cuniculorum]
MKKAFSLIEIIISVVILAVIFSSFSLYYEQIYKNYEPLKLLENLYILEEKLNQNSNFKIYELKISGLNSLNIGEEIAKDEAFELKSLKILDQNYSVYFQ